jgi:hypothetical protein
MTSSQGNSDGREVVASSEASTEQLILEELRQMNKSFAFILQRLDVQHQKHSKALDEVRDLLNGFTGGGASFNAYQTDALTSAYLSIVGPLMAARLAAPGQPTNLPEMLKGSLMLAKTLLEELAAYRSQRQGIDYLEDQAALINDPWSKPQA